MSEERIIDGVNVAECMFYEKNAVLYDCTEDTTSGDNECYKCKDNPDCYYKQLKRLEQERNEWKKKYEDAANENLLEIYELIKKNDAYRGIVNVVNSKLEQENTELKAEKAKYRKALEEIREIATNAFNLEDDDGGYLYQKILTKINEVLK